MLESGVLSAMSGNVFNVLTSASVAFLLSFFRLCPPPHRSVGTIRLPAFPLTAFLFVCESPALLMALWSSSEPFK